jgi:hypothetical protein
LASTAYAIGMKDGWNGKGAEERQGDSYHKQYTFHGCFLLGEFEKRTVIFSSAGSGKKGHFSRAPVRNS